MTYESPTVLATIETAKIVSEAFGTSSCTTH